MKQSSLGSMFSGIRLNEGKLEPERQILLNRMERGTAWDFLSATDPLTGVPIVWTRDENNEAGEAAFPAYLEYLNDFTSILDFADIALVEKSRQMIVTTTILCVYLYRVLFRKSQRILLSKVIQENAEELLENKIRYTYRRLPDWLKAKKLCKERPKHMFKCSDTQSYISAVSMNVAEREARGGTATDVFIDEGAYQDNFKAIWDASLPMAKRLCSVTTPNIATLGGRAFYNLISPAHGLYSAYKDNPGIGIRQIETKEKDATVKIHAIRLHYTADPAKRGAVWLANARAKMTDRLAFNREYEIDWSSTTGLPFYTQFYDKYAEDPSYYVRPLRLPTKGVIYRGFDFGFRKPACVWFSVSPSGRVFIYREFLPKDIDVFSFRDAVRFLSGEIPRDHKDLVRRERADQWIRIAGNQPFFVGHPLTYVNYAGSEANSPNTVETDKGEMNDAEIFAGGKIELTLLAHRVSAGTYMIRKLMMPHPDGKGSSVLIDPQCQTLIRGLAGGLTFGAGTKADPVDDEVADSPEFGDIHDAFRYGVTGAIGTWEEGKTVVPTNPFADVASGLPKGVFKREPPRRGPETPTPTAHESWASMFGEDE